MLALKTKTTAGGPEHISEVIRRMAWIIPPHICPDCGYRRDSQQCKHSGNPAQLAQLEAELEEIEQ